jgi:hypothetical protein
MPHRSDGGITLRQEYSFSAPPETVWSIIRGNKLAVLAAGITGCALPFGLKYIFAAILIAFILTGGR